MFKICNDKTYYVVQTTSEDVVVEIYTKKDGRGSDISLHEMHLDLCRAIRKLQHDGYTIMKVYPACATEERVLMCCLCRNSSSLRNAPTTMLRKRSSFLTSSQEQRSSCLAR